MSEHNNGAPQAAPISRKKTRRLVAIMHADAVGFTRLAGRSEDGTLDALGEARKRFETAIESHEGRIVETAGDSILAEFASVMGAVSAAVDVQRSFVEKQVLPTPGEVLTFRIGIHLSDIIPDGSHIHGDGVNLTQRIESVADSGGICISASVHEQVRDKLPLTYDDLGEIQLKNVARRVRLFKVRWDGGQPDAIIRVSAVGGIVPPLPARPTIAVLPFLDLTETQTDHYFADGITDSIINSLACSRWFVVIGRGTSFKFRDANKDPRDIGRELGARYLLHGSVQRRDNRARVMTHLVDTNSGHLLKSHRHDELLSDVLKLQDAIAIQVASTLEPEVLKAESLRLHGSSESVSALDHVFRAYSKLWEMSPEGTRVAQHHLELAKELDPCMAQAHVGLAMAALLRVYMGWSERPNEEVLEAHTCATKAIELDRDDAWAHMALGVVGLQTGNLANAIPQLKRALQLNPSLALGYGFLATALIFDGLYEDATKALRIALRLSPRDWFLFYWFDALAMAHVLAGRWAEATEYAAKAVEENPKWPGGHRMLAVSRALSGDAEQASLALVDMLRLQPGMSRSYLQRILPFRSQAHFDLILRGLRGAGWCETA